MKTTNKIKYRYQGLALLLLMLFIYVCPSSILAQSNSFIKESASTSMTIQQQHYLSVLMGYDQYVSHRIVQVNPAALEANTVDLQLAPGVTVNMEKHKIVKRSTNDYSWFGSVDGDNFSTINIVVHGDMVTGIFRFGGDLYSLVPLGEGLHAFVIEDPSSFVDHNEESYRQLPEIDMKNTEQESRHDDGTIERYIPNQRADEEEDGIYRGGGDCDVRMLIAYTDDVAAAHADPLAGIQVAVDNYNNSNDNSAVNFDVEIARVVEVTYAESGVFSTDRNRFRNTSDGYMDNIHDLRQLYDADYCQLVVEDVNEGEGCGLAYGIGVTYSDAFCASKYSCIGGNLTFAHEFAHLHGCRHDTYVDNTNTPYSYGHGHINYPDRWRTVMCYNDYCDDLGNSCTRVQWWSNPNVNISGAWGGDVTGVAGSEDNETVLDVTEATVAGWETQVTNKSVYSADVIYAYEEGNFEGLSTLSTVSSTSTYLDFRNNSRGIMKAGDEITLNEGFWARSGSDVSIFLETCNVVTANGENGNNSVVSNVEEDLSVANFFNVYPNPFTRDLRVEFNLNQDAPVTAILYDILGQEVLRTTTGKQYPAGNVIIDVESGGLERGVYILSVWIGDEELHSERVVKMN